MAKAMVMAMAKAMAVASFLPSFIPSIFHACVSSLRRGKGNTINIIQSTENIPLALDIEKIATNIQITNLQAMAMAKASDSDCRSGRTQN